MAKPAPSRGLPEDFAFSIDTKTPVVLGDFLDETIGSQPIVAPKTIDIDFRKGREVEPVSVPPQVVEAPVISRPKEQSIVQTPVVEEQNPKKSTRGRSATDRPPSFEVSSDPDTMARIEDILADIRRNSAEPDTRLSELIEASIIILHQARDHFDFSRIPKRGRWGTPQEKHFTSALSAALEQSLANWFRDRESRQ